MEGKLTQFKNDIQNELSKGIVAYLVKYAGYVLTGKSSVPKLEKGNYIPNSKYVKQYEEYVKNNNGRLKWSRIGSTFAGLEFRLNVQEISMANDYGQLLWLRSIPIWHGILWEEDRIQAVKNWPFDTILVQDPPAPKCQITDETTLGKIVKASFAKLEPITTMTQKAYDDYGYLLPYAGVALATAAGVMYAQNQDFRAGTNALISSGASSGYNLAKSGANLASKPFSWMLGKVWTSPSSGSYVPYSPSSLYSASSALSESQVKELVASKFLDNLPALPTGQSAENVNKVVHAVYGVTEKIYAAARVGARDAMSETVTQGGSSASLFGYLSNSFRGVTDTTGVVNMVLSPEIVPNLSGEESAKLSAWSAILRSLSNSSGSSAPQVPTIAPAPAASSNLAMVGKGLGVAAVSLPTMALSSRVYGYLAGRGGARAPVAPPTQAQAPPTQAQTSTPAQAPPTQAQAPPTQAQAQTSTPTRASNPPDQEEPRKLQEFWSLAKEITDPEDQAKQLEDESQALSSLVLQYGEGKTREDEADAALAQFAGNVAKFAQYKDDREDQVERLRDLLLKFPDDASRQSLNERYDTVVKEQEYVRGRVKAYQRRLGDYTRNIEDIKKKK
mgnify:CR=1 FL=1